MPSLALEDDATQCCSCNLATITKKSYSDSDIEFNRACLIYNSLTCSRKAWPSNSRLVELCADELVVGGGVGWSYDRRRRRAAHFLSAAAAWLYGRRRWRRTREH